VTEYARPEENTLGIILGKRNRGGVPAGSTAGRAMRQASARGASLGTGYLGIGATVLAGVQGLHGLGMFVVHARDYPNVLPVAAAWLIYAIAIIAVAVAISMRGELMPNWMFAAYTLALAAVVALDLLAIWPLHNVGTYATASISAGFGLLAALTLRRAREILGAAALLGLALVGAILATTPLTSATTPAQIIAVAVAVMPAVFGVFVIRRFRRIVQLELDRVLVQSTVSAPRFAVGMLASEELARLDLAAEELLDSVSNGRIPLPLGPKTASIAASLATELRLEVGDVLVGGPRRAERRHLLDGCTTRSRSPSNSASP